MSVRDFTANQIRTAKVIMTGSATQGGINHKNLQLSVYSESVTSDELGTNPTAAYDNVGTEVAIFVSGSVNYSGRSSANSHVLFNGNLGTSGSMHFMNPATPVAASLLLSTVDNGTVAHGMAVGQKLTLLNAAGVEKVYVLVDPVLSDTSILATSHTPLAANAELTSNSSITGVKGFKDNAITITGAVANNNFTFNVPATANGQAVLTNIVIKASLATASANTIQILLGSLTRDILIKAINGTADAAIRYAASGGGTAGIPGITASAATDAAMVKLTLDRPGDHTVPILNTDGTMVQNQGADYFDGGGGAVTMGTAGEIAVRLTTGENQATVLNSIRAAILSSTGHNGTIAASAALTPAASQQSITLTQATDGAVGNVSVVTDTLAKITAPGNFTGGSGLSKAQDVFAYADNNREKHLYLKGALYASGSRDRKPRGTISGSIHHTRDGLSYLVAGDGVTIASASNGQVTIGASSANITRILFSDEGPNTYFDDRIISGTDASTNTCHADVCSPSLRVFGNEGRINNGAPGDTAIVFGSAREFVDNNSGAVSLHTSPSNPLGLQRQRGFGAVGDTIGLRFLVPDGKDANSNIKFTLRYSLSDAPGGEVGSQVEMRLSGRRALPTKAALVGRASGSFSGAWRNNLDSGPEAPNNAGYSPDGWLYFKVSTGPLAGFISLTSQTTGVIYETTSQTFKIKDLVNSSDASVGAGDQIDLLLMRNAGLNTLLGKVATANFSVSGGAINGLTITDPGTNYGAAGLTTNFIPLGGGSNANIQATFSGGAAPKTVVGATIVNGGSGYSAGSGFFMGPTVSSDTYSAVGGAGFYVHSVEIEIS